MSQTTPRRSEALHEPLNEALAQSLWRSLVLGEVLDLCAVLPSAWAFPLPAGESMTAVLARASDADLQVVNHALDSLAYTAQAGACTAQAARAYDAFVMGCATLVTVLRSAAGVGVDVEEARRAWAVLPAWAAAVWAAVGEAAQRLRLSSETTPVAGLVALVGEVAERVPEAVRDRIAPLMRGPDRSPAQRQVLSDAWQDPGDGSAWGGGGRR